MGMKTLQKSESINTTLPKCKTIYIGEEIAVLIKEIYGYSVSFKGKVSTHPSYKDAMRHINRLTND